MVRLRHTGINCALDDHFFDLVLRQAVIDRRAHMQAEFIPGTKRDRGREHADGAHATIETGPRPDITPRRAGDEFLEFLVEWRDVGERFVDPGVAENGTADLHAVVVAGLLVGHQRRPLRDAPLRGAFFAGVLLAAAFFAAPFFVAPFFVAPFFVAPFLAAGFFAADFFAAAFLAIPFFPAAFLAGAFFVGAAFFAAARLRVAALLATGFRGGLRPAAWRGGTRRAGATSRAVRKSITAWLNASACSIFERCAASSVTMRAPRIVSAIRLPISGGVAGSREPTTTSTGFVTERIDSR